MFIDYRNFEVSTSTMQPKSVRFSIAKNYDRLRHKHFDPLNLNISINLLLFGNRNMNDDFMTMKHYLYVFNVTLLKQNDLIRLQ